MSFSYWLVLLNIFSDAYLPSWVKCFHVSCPFSMQIVFWLKKKKNNAKKKKYIFVLPSTLVCDLSRFSSLPTLRLSPGYCRREKSGKGEPVPFLKPKSHLTPCFGVNGFYLWPPTSIKQDSYGEAQWVLCTSPQITSIPTASWAHLDIRKKAVTIALKPCRHVWIFSNMKLRSREGPKKRWGVAFGGISSSFTTLCHNIRPLCWRFVCLLVSSIWEWSWCCDLCRFQSNLEVRFTSLCSCFILF